MHLFLKSEENKATNPKYALSPTRAGRRAPGGGKNMTAPCQPTSRVTAKPVDFPLICHSESAACLGTLGSGSRALQSLDS